VTERKRFEELFLKLEAIFFHYDPIGINFSTNTDEYAFEVSMVLSQLPLAKSEEEVHTMVYEAFCALFDIDMAGEKQSVVYQKIAKETWEVWGKYFKRKNIS